MTPAGRPPAAPLRPLASLLRRPRRAGVDVIAIVAVWFITFGLTVVLAAYVQRAAFVFFWGAVLFAAWYAGFRAAIVAAIASVLAVDYFVIAPLGTFNFADPAELLTLGIFVAASALVSALAAAAARAQREATGLAMQLQEQAVELEQQTEAAHALGEELEHTNVQLEEALHDAEEARTAAEAGGDRARRLLAVASGLNEASEPDQVAEVVFREAMAAVGADAGALALLHFDEDGGATFETVRMRGFPTRLNDRYRRYPLAAGRPLSDAVLAGAPILLASSDEWRARYPDAYADTGGMEYEAFAAVPAMSGDRALAGIALSFREPRTFDDATRTFLATLGEQCGLALERARAFDAERRARELSTTTLASIRDGFVALDREFRYRYVNPAAEELLRRPASELLGRDMWEAFPQAADAPLGRAYRRVMATRVAEAFESESLVLGMWLEGRIYPSPDGITVFFQDVTRRKRSQDANRFLVEVSRLLNESLDPSLVLNAVATAAVPTLGDWCAIDLRREPGSDGWPPVLDRVAIVHQDPAMVALGARLAEQYPTDWSDGNPMSAVLRDGAPLFVPAITDEMLATGARSPEHASLLRALRFRSVIVVPIAARGQTLGTLTLCMTESERRYDESDLALAGDVARRVGTALDNARLYAAAEAARASAEAANAAKSQFLATMSHELRTPLNAIAGHVQLLELGLYGAVNDTQREALERVARAQRHLLGLINDVLNYARLEGARVEYDLQPTELRDVIAEVMPMVEPQLVAKGITFDAHLPVDAAGVRVWADREKLTQIFLNLLSNAVKFTPSGGRVTVEHASRADASEPSDLAFVRVVDTGIGIPRDKLEAVFEPFVQLGKSYARDAGGTGLGLAISRDLARGMGGDLRARSVEGKGSTFTVALRRVI